MAADLTSVKLLLKTAMAGPTRWLLGRRRLRVFVARHLARFPALDSRTRAVVRSTNPHQAGMTKKGAPKSLRDLPESVREVVADLERAIERQGRR